MTGHPHGVSLFLERSPVPTYPAPFSVVKAIDPLKAFCVLDAPKALDIRPFIAAMPSDPKIASAVYWGVFDPMSRDGDPVIICVRRDPDLSFAQCFPIKPGDPDPI